MPTYNYVCEDCGQKFERFHSFNHNPAESTCPRGHQHVHRVFTPPAIVFKGSGFYKTDHRPKEKASSE